MPRRIPAGLDGISAVPGGIRIGRRIIQPGRWFHQNHSPRAAFGWTAYAPLAHPGVVGPDAVPREVTTGVVPQAVLDGPRVELPGRDYLLATGPVSAALAFVGDTRPTEVPWDQSPHLWWAADQSWCVATDIDLDSTYVGGGRELVDAILADPHLEAVPADPGDSILTRYPDWVDDLAEQTAAELIRHGRAQTVTDWGTVDARLRRPRLGVTGSLEVRRPSGSSSETLLRDLPDDDLRERARRGIAEGLVETVLDAE